MAFTRSDCIAYLVSQFPDLAKDVDMDTSDTPAGYGGVVDDALLEYGIPFEDLAAGEVAYKDVKGFHAVLRYYALLRFSHALAVRVDVYTDHPNPDAKRSQAVRNVMRLIDEAKVEAIGYGYFIELSKNDLDGGVFQRISLVLDSQEPRCDG